MVKIFLITPQDKKVKAKIIYADNEDEARVMTHAGHHSATKRNDDRVYIDEELSDCEQVTVEIISSYSCTPKSLDTIMVKYKEKTYYLKKNEAEDV